MTAIDLWFDVLDWFHNGEGRYESRVLTDSEKYQLHKFIDRCNHTIYVMKTGKYLILEK